MAFNVDPSGPVWRKSTASGPAGGACVEVALVAQYVLIRNSKDPSGPTLKFTTAEWAAFLKGAQRGEFSPPEPQI